MRSSSSRLLLTCCALALTSAAATTFFGDLRAHAWRFVGTAGIWCLFAGVAAWHCRRLSAVPTAVLLTGVLLRLVLLASPPTLSDDVFRYLWEGHIQWSGFNPFLFPPDHMDLLPNRDAVYEQVAHRTVPTIYPPLAQWLFAGASLFYSPLAWKGLAAAADLGIMWVLARNGRVWAAVLWALHPLPAVESAASGHLEPIAILLALCALAKAERDDAKGASLLATLGGGIKLLPVVLLPVLLRGRSRQEVFRISAACCGLAAVVSLPYLSAGSELSRGLQTYAQHWSHNASVFSVLLWGTGDPIQARLLGAGIGVGVVLWAWTQRLPPGEFLLWITGALVLLSPVVHPWYVLWPLAAGLWVGSWPFSVLASTCLLSYGVLQGYDPAVGDWEELTWIPWLEYPPLLLALLAARWRHWGASAPEAA